VASADPATIWPSTKTGLCTSAGSGAQPLYEMSVPLAMTPKLMHRVLVAGGWIARRRGAPRERDMKLVSALVDRQASMDSYLKSSAVNRRHYALAHKIENTTSVQEADTAVWTEVERIRAEVGRGLVSATVNITKYNLAAADQRARRTYYIDVLSYHCRCASCHCGRPRFCLTYRCKLSCYRSGH
jgi:hypothetical protein